MKTSGIALTLIPEYTELKSMMTKRFERCLVKAVLILSVAFAFASGLQADDFCALSVRLLEPDGTPARGARIQILDPSGRAIFNDHVKGSDFQLCDFGFGLHKLRVGIGVCHPVTVENIRLRLEHPIKLVVRAQECPPDDWGRGNCRIYLRVRDSQRPLPHAKIAFDRDQGGETDEYGRLEAVLKPRTLHSAVISKPGYQERKLALSCRKDDFVEREIHLHPVK